MRTQGSLMVDLPEGLFPITESPPGLIPVGEDDIVTISSGLPRLPRKEPLDISNIPGYQAAGMSALTEESNFSYRKRAAEYYGFDKIPEKHFDNYEKLEEAAGFLPSRKIEYLQKIADKAFDGEAKVKRHREFGEPVLEFDTGEIVPFEETGTGLQTLRGARAGTEEILMEVAGGGLGMGGGIPGVVGGVGLGILSQNYRGYKQANDAFDLGLTEMEMVGQAALNSVIAMGFEVGTIGVGAVVRRMLMNPVAKNIIGDLTADQINAAVKAAEDFDGPILTGQALQKARKEGAEIAKRDIEELRTLEEGLAKSGQGPEVRGILKEQDIAAQRATREVTEAAAAERTLLEEEFGAEAIEAARRDVSIQREQIERTLDTERAAVDTAIGEIISPPDMINTVDDVRRYLVDAADETIEQHRKKYRELWADVPEGTVVDVKSVKAAARKTTSTIEKDLFPHLTEESKIILTDALKIGDDEPIANVSRAISQLKTERRMMEAGTVPDRAKRVLNDMISELSEARRKALSDIDPALRDRLDLLDEQYSVINQEVYGNIVGKLYDRNKQGAFRIADDRLLKTLLSAPQEMRRIVNMIKDPEFGGFGQTEALKEGVMQLYRDQVLNRTGATHASFMNKYGESIKEIFSPKEQRIFGSLRDFQSAGKRIEARQKKLLSDLDTSFEGKIERAEPDLIFNTIMVADDKVRKSNIVKLKRIMTVDEFDGFKSVYARDFIARMQDDTPYGKEFSPRKLNEALENTAELRAVFGDQYVTDLEWLKKVTDITKPLPGTRGRATEILGEASAASPIQLFLRSTLFRPLSREGVFFTGALKLGRKAARRASDRIMSDPKLLKRAHALYRKDAPLKEWKSFFRTIGYDQLADQLYEEE